MSEIPNAEGVVLDCAGKALDLGRARVMGVLNLTPDSFSDGGRYASRRTAVERAWAMVHEGAAIIDVGGESTRPGAAAVSEEEEIARVVPVIEQLARELRVPISIDTSKPGVMRVAFTGTLRKVDGFGRKVFVADAALAG